MAQNAFTSITLAFLTLFFQSTYSQNSISISAPVTFNEVEVLNNWHPPTTINRKDKFKGDVLGYGMNLAYSIKPTFLVRNSPIFLIIGGGYQKLRFNVERPFDYNSSFYPIFRTDHYNYHCLQIMIGVSYRQFFGKKYFLEGIGSLYFMQSLRQEYAPRSNGADNSMQVNQTSIFFGNNFILSVCLNRMISKSFSLGLGLLAPVYVRWRNDAIFKDDPNTFYGPKFGFGINLNLAYHFKTK